MTPQPDTWRVASWSRADGEPPTPLPPSIRAGLSAEVAALDDDQPVTVRAGVLRALLAQGDQPRTRGAAVTDTDRRVTYLTTIRRDADGPRLRTVEVVPHDDDPDPRVFRVPVAAVAAQTAYVLAQQDDTAAATDGDASDVLVWGEPDTGGPPSPETLLRLVQQRVPRHRIADHYGRSLSRVDQWLRAARKERPDLPWPPPRRGPQPRRPDGSPAPGSREAGWAHARAQAQTPGDPPGHPEAEAGETGHAGEGESK